MLSGFCRLPVSGLSAPFDPGDSEPFPMGTCIERRSLGGGVVVEEKLSERLSIGSEGLRGGAASERSLCAGNAIIAAAVLGENLEKAGGVCTGPPGPPDSSDDLPGIGIGGGGGGCSGILCSHSLCSRNPFIQKFMIDLVLSAEIGGIPAAVLSASKVQHFLCLDVSHPWYTAQPERGR